MTVLNPGDYATVHGYVRDLTMTVSSTGGVCVLNTVLGGGLNSKYSALDWRDWIHVLTKSDGELALQMEDATRETYVYYTPHEGFYVAGARKRDGAGGGGPCTGFDLRRWLYSHEYAKPVFRSQVPSLGGEQTVDGRVRA